LLKEQKLIPKEAWDSVVTRLLDYKKQHEFNIQNRVPYTPRHAAQRKASRVKKLIVETKKYSEITISELLYYSDHGWDSACDADNKEVRLSFELVF
jgi:hypothetical protein